MVETQQAHNSDFRAACASKTVVPDRLEPETAAPELGPPTSDAQRLLALQGQVGNQAVAKLVENRTGIPDGLKQGLETLSGFDLSHVRVHRDSKKPAEVQALAYTQGSEIHLGPGQEHTLAHEAWHAVQQMQGRVRQTGTVGNQPLNDSESLEREADIMGAKVQALARNQGATGANEPTGATSLRPHVNLPVTQRLRERAPRGPETLDIDKLRGEAATRKVMHQWNRAPEHDAVMAQIRRVNGGPPSAVDDGERARYSDIGAPRVDSDKGELLGKGWHGEVHVAADDSRKVVKSVPEDGTARARRQLNAEHEKYQQLGDQENIAKYHPPRAPDPAVPDPAFAAPSPVTLDRYDMTVGGLEAEMDYLGLSVPATFEGDQLRGSERQTVAEHVQRESQKGLDHMHGLGLGHNDIKPANIGLDAGGTPKILDMGTVKPLGEAGFGDRNYYPSDGQLPGRTSALRDRAALEQTTRGLLRYGNSSAPDPNAPDSNAVQSTRDFQSNALYPAYPVQNSNNALYPAYPMQNSNNALYPAYPVQNSNNAPYPYSANDSDVETGEVEFAEGELQDRN